MIRSRAVIKTSNASKYLTQLCKHWNHKFEFTYTDNEAHIPFKDGVLLDIFADPAELAVQIEAPSEAETLHIEQIFISHIERFAFRETLEFDWHRETLA